MRETLFELYFVKGASDPEVVAMCKACEDVRKGFLMSKEAAKVYMLSQHELEQFISEMDEYERLHRRSTG